MHIHYHANFAVYIDGNRQEFKGTQYYQEVSICSNSKAITIPQQRAHLHDDINNLVHVHDHVVTWGQFFENLGWVVGPNFIYSDNGKLYSEDAQNKLNIIINNQDYTDLTAITNMVILDKSKLLISYGSIDSSTLKKEYSTIPSTAAYNDTHKDPASCSGGEDVTFSDRIHHLL